MEGTRLCNAYNPRKPNTADHNYSLACNSHLKVKINDEREHKVKILYFGNVLGVYVDGELVVSTKIDLPQKLETEDGLFWIGFTAATGGLSENHDVLSWNVKI